MKTETQTAERVSVASTGLVRLFLVVWDDEQGLCCPMAWDDDCEGAICGCGGIGKIAIFTSRKAARVAINVSAKFAALRRAQGKPENTDFLEGKAQLRIMECQPNARGMAPGSAVPDSESTNELRR